MEVETVSAVPSIATEVKVSNETDKRDGLEAPVKKEFRLQRDSLKRPIEEVSKEVEDNGVTQDDEMESKKCCTTNASEEKPHESKREKKKRKQEQVQDRFKNQLCSSAARGEPCSYGEKCKYNHNVEEYLAKKPQDIGDRCYVFDTFGKCSFGYQCRFASSHIKDGKLIVNEELAKQPRLSFEKNHLNKQMQVKLRKRGQVKFPRAEAIIKNLAEQKKRRNEETNMKGANQQELQKERLEQEKKDREQIVNALNNNNNNAVTTDNNNNNTDTNTNNNNNESTTTTTTIHVQSEEGTGFDREIKLKPQEKKKINFKNQLFLAPLTTIGNLPYRRVCKQLGADITCGEMALATNLLQGHAPEWALTHRHSSEKTFGIQICGAHPDALARCAELLEDQVEMDFLDINMGCPIDLIYNKGAGSALLENPRKMQDIVASVSAVLNTTPLTIKVRTGRDEKSPTTHKLFPKFEEWGASAVTIHGRSRQQRYSREANWEYIKQCASLTNLPVIGNGDIFSYQDYEDHMENTGVSSVMLARGAIIKPWLFTEIKEKRHWDISSRERLDIIRDFCNFGLEHWGSDTEGVNRTRRFLLEWLSFLHRYIPVGLLEVLPAKLNQRPPKYFGRDDLETLMASSEVSDWIKISSMFLGPPPSDFAFAAKHKSNSYSDSNG